MNVNATLLASRILLVLLFLMSAFGMAANTGGVAGYFGSLGLPLTGLTVWLVVVLKIVAGLAVLVGWNTRYASWALAAFSIAAALIGHNNVADQNEMTHLLKDFAIAGGFLALSVAGAGAWSLEGRRR